MISPSSTNTQVTEIGDMIFRVCFIDPFQGYVGAKFATDKGFKTAAILFNRAQPTPPAFAAISIRHSPTWAAKSRPSRPTLTATTTFAQLTAIRQTHPDFIYIPGYCTEVVNIAKQARQLGITCPLIGGDGWDSEELKNAGTALDGCYFSNHYSHEEKRPEVQEFVKKYQDEFGKVPDGLAAMGYDAAILLFDAMGRAKSMSGDDLADAIASTKDFQAVTGKITIDENHNAKKLAVMEGITNGVPHYEATIQPPE